MNVCFDRWGVVNNVDTASHTIEPQSHLEMFYHKLKVM